MDLVEDRAHGCSTSATRTGRAHVRRVAPCLIAASALLLGSCSSDSETIATTTTRVDVTTAPTTSTASTTTTATTMPPSAGSGVDEVAADLGKLNDIAVDADGTPWVTEANASTLLEITADGPVAHYTGELTSGDPESEMSGLAIAPDGTIWFATRKGVAMLDPATDEAELVVASATTDLGGPIYRLAVDAEGEVLIGDVGQRKVFRWDGSALVHVAGAGTAPVADADATGPAVDAVLGDIRDLAVDADGNLYIADDYGQRVRKVTPDGAISTFAGGGEVAAVSDAVAAPSDTSPDALDLEAPTGVWVVGETVYVTDITHGIVMAFDASSGYELVLGADELSGAAERGAGLVDGDHFIIINASTVGRIR